MALSTTTIHLQNALHLAQLKLCSHYTWAPLPPPPTPHYLFFVFLWTTFDLRCSYHWAALVGVTGTRWLVPSEPFSLRSPKFPFLASFYYFSSCQPRFMFFSKWVLEFCHFVFLYLPQTGEPPVLSSAQRMLFCSFPCLWNILKYIQLS